MTDNPEPQGSRKKRRGARIRVADIRNEFVEQKDAWKRLADISMMLSFIVGIVFIVHIVVIEIQDLEDTSMHNAVMMFAPFMIATGLKLYNSFVASWSVQLTFLFASAASAILAVIALLLDQGYKHSWDHRDKTNAVANSHSQSDWTRIINWSATALIGIDFIFALRQAYALWQWRLAADAQDSPDFENAAFETKEVHPIVSPWIPWVFALVQPALGVALFVAYFAVRYAQDGPWACSFESATVVMITAALYYGYLVANLMCYSRNLVVIRWILHVIALLGSAYGVYADSIAKCQGSNTGVAVVRSFGFWMIVVLVTNLVSLAWLDHVVRQGYSRDNWRELPFDGLITVSHIGGLKPLDDAEEDEEDSLDSKHAKAKRQKLKGKGKGKGKSANLMSDIELEPLISPSQTATSSSARLLGFTGGAGAISTALLRPPAAAAARPNA
jgi:hypothetical protein